mgnify:CR=1 FL=1
MTVFLRVIQKHLFSVCLKDTEEIVIVFINRQTAFKIVLQEFPGHRIITVLIENTREVNGFHGLLSEYVSAGYPVKHPEKETFEIVDHCCILYVDTYLIGPGEKCITNLLAQYLKKAPATADRTCSMKGTVKDLLKVSGVHGYALVRDKSIQIKLPSKHRFSGAKDSIMRLYQNIVPVQKRPGNIVEIYLEDMVLTMFVSGITMLMVISSTRVNLALLRMTGKLVIANMTKESR